MGEAGFCLPHFSSAGQRSRQETEACLLRPVM